MQIGDQLRVLGVEMGSGHRSVYPVETKHVKEDK